MVADLPDDPPGLLVLLHGAGTSSDVPVLLTCYARMRAGGWAVARLDQPYRVQGRKAPAPAGQLDAVVIEVIGWLRARIGGQPPLVLAGRSSGARVACRVAAATAATGIVAFGFPLRPPGGRPTRQGELDAAGVPVLVVQGERDPFGRPRASAAQRRVVRVIRGADHVLRTRKADGRSEGDVVREAVEVSCAWLGRLPGQAPV